jgi:hypothetical protein
MIQFFIWSFIDYYKYNYIIYYYNNNFYNYHYYLALKIVSLNFLYCEILLNIFKFYIINYLFDNYIVGVNLNYTKYYERLPFALQF